MADVLGFYPKYGTSTGIKSVSYEAGSFLITLDDKKIYFDVDGRRHLVAEGKSSTLYKGIFTISNWDYLDSDQIYSQTVSLSGINGTIPAIIDLVISSSPEIGLEEQNQWAKISRVVLDKDKVTAYCYDSQPSIDLNFQVREV